MLYLLSQGCDLEKSHSFQQFLVRLKNIWNPDEGDAAPEVIKCNSGANGNIIAGESLYGINQSDIVGNLPRFEGASLAIAETNGKVLVN